jgi:uncharacterized protein with GYD domain
MAGEGPVAGRRCDILKEAKIAEVACPMGKSAGEDAVPTYIVLGNYTEQGIQKIKQLEQLRKAAERWVASKNGRMISNYTTFGPYDFVVTLELPSDEVALEGAFTFGSQGDVRTQTLKAFEYQEAESIAGRIP